MLPVPLQCQCECLESRSEFTLDTQGDGIEFKKIFRQVKDQCTDIICKPPPIQ